MNVLLTGGEGFLGINLAMRLRRDGHFVVSLDNRSTSDEVAWRLACEDEPKLLDVERITCDVGNWNDPPPQFGKLLPIKNHPPDLVYHLACPASPKRYAVMPLATLGAAILGAQRLLDQFDCPVVLASTSEIYGEPLDHPQSEWLRAHINPRGPRACYESGKLAMEAIAECYSNAYTVRVFNTMGPFMAPDDGRVVSTFICAALQGKPLPIQGGKQTRTFCYVDDLIDGLVKYGMRAGRDIKDTRVLNLGNDRVEITMEDLASHIQLIHTGATVREHVALPEDDPSRRRPDITLAHKVLGWSPTISLDDGLRRTYAYFKRRLAA